MKKWRCTVCNYIHEGDEPPEVCPVCGAGRDKFVEEVEAPKEAPEEPNQPEGGFLARQVVKHHLHPMSVHVPNGVIPASFTFVVVAVALDFAGLAQAAFYNLIFVLVSMPLVLFSGYIAWKSKYGGHLTVRFVLKFISGAVVTLTTLALLGWHIVDPRMTAAESPYRWVVVLVNLVLLAAAGLAGYIGGKLVFHSKDG